MKSDERNNHCAIDQIATDKQRNFICVIGTRKNNRNGGSYFLITVYIKTSESSNVFFFLSITFVMKFDVEQPL